MGSRPDRFADEVAVDAYLEPPMLPRDAYGGLGDKDRYIADQAWRALAAFSKAERRDLPEWVVGYLLAVAPDVVRDALDFSGEDNRTRLRDALKLAGRLPNAHRKALDFYLQVEDWRSGQPRMSDAQAYTRYLTHIGDRDMKEDVAKRRYYQGREMVQRT